MSPRPEAIDSRLVFRIYAAAALPLGIVTYMWPLILPESVPSQEWAVRLRLAAAVVTGLGTCAAAFGAIEDPLARRRGLLGFAHAHVMMGAMLLIQAQTAWVSTLSAPLAWGALIVGVVLFYLAITGPGADLTPGLRPLPPDAAPPGAPTLALRHRGGLARLRSEYEQQIRQAARQEERARLARDLHDAVKQQLFVIQTAAATAQARFDGDPPGARQALDQVRTSAREAMSEMEAMLEQLQATPIDNDSLVAFLRRQCEALGFQTGARVNFTAGTLPAPAAVDPAARQTIARVAQEALSNVARHARATHVDVTLDTIDGRLVLLVKDDGSGFQMGRDLHPMGMGMRNIGARAADVGGAVDIASVPGTGTTVRFSVPCADVSSPRPYLIRAVVWTALALSTLVLLSRGVVLRPVAVALLLVAAIAVARYAVAARALTKTGEARRARRACEERRGAQGPPQATSRGAGRSPD